MGGGLHLRHGKSPVRLIQGYQIISLIPKKDPGIADFSIPNPGIEKSVSGCDH